MQYTHEQKKVIQHPLSRHAIVSAVAGSGKTQTLIGRVEHLIKKGIAPHRILIVMFNKSASVDFQRRAVEVLGHHTAQLLQIKTFHALGFQMVQKLERMRYITPSRLVTADYEVQNAVRKALQAAQKMDNNHEEITTERVELFTSYVSLMKAELNEVSKHSFFKKMSKKERALVEVFYKIYESNRQTARYSTYDDLIYVPCSLFAKDAKVAAQFSALYDHIIVDEYQDINHSQQVLLKTIAGGGAKVMVVGDVDQTIYEWRGSNPDYMLKGFEQDFPNAVVYNLSYTFRYGHLLSMIANEVIHYNKARHAKQCLTAPTVKVATEVNIYAKREIARLVKEIKQLTASGHRHEDIGILVRKYSSAILLELHCLHEGLAYSILGSGGVFELGIVKALCGYIFLTQQAKYLKTLELPQRQTLIQAMLFYPSMYLNSQQLRAVVDKISAQPAQAGEILADVAIMGELNGYQAKRIAEYAKGWQKIIDMGKNFKVTELFKLIDTELKLGAYLVKKASNHYMFSEEEVYESFTKYLTKIRGDIDTVAQELLRLADIAQQAKIGVSTDKKVQICSIHRAKGLQWRTVVLCDMTEESFFGDDHSPSEATVESERRLFYVAVTRAVERLMILAGNDLTKLQQWYDKAYRSYPSTLTKVNSVRFLYESKIARCQSFLSHYHKEDIKGLSQMTKHKLFGAYLKHLLGQSNESAQPNKALES